ncbi:hypothetical protein SLEP1_g54776 [Rubroshorea leprosula]|uniref:Transmembrane protein n=1 Tax=Rubroshorea leprosula TaxID=152421 RepID=A0AAV5MDM5_9ROSI|nr:hypothetical protein SLEP1_g54776 [Rubroshorea leprosula]
MTASKSPSAATKHHSPIKAEAKAISSLYATGRTMVFAYGVTFAFVVCTAFLVPNPSSSSSPWIKNFLKSSSSSSRFSSLFFSFVSNSSQTDGNPLPFTRPPAAPFRFLGKAADLVTKMRLCPVMEKVERRRMFGYSIKRVLYFHSDCLFLSASSLLVPLAFAGSWLPSLTYLRGASHLRQPEVRGRPCHKNIPYLRKMNLNFLCSFLYSLRKQHLFSLSVVKVQDGVYVPM